MSLTQTPTPAAALFTAFEMYTLAILTQDPGPSLILAALHPLGLGDDADILTLALRNGRSQLALRAGMRVDDDGELVFDETSATLAMALRHAPVIVRVDLAEDAPRATTPTRPCALIMLISSDQAVVLEGMSSGAWLAQLILNPTATRSAIERARANIESSSPRGTTPLSVHCAIRGSNAGWEVLKYRLSRSTAPAGANDADSPDILATRLDEYVSDGAET